MSPIQYSNEYIDITFIPSVDYCNVRCVGFYKGGELAELIAAAPVDFLVSYTGSFQPFPNASIAFENTPNRYVLSGNFDVVFRYPNSYYAEAAWEKVPPSIFLKVNGRLIRFALPERFPLKSQTYRDSKPNGREGPTFYSRRELMGVRSQESILRDFENAKINMNTA